MNNRCANTTLSSALALALLGVTSGVAWAQTAPVDESTQPEQSQNQGQDRRKVTRPFQYSNATYDFYEPGRTVMLGVRGTF